MDKPVLHEEHAAACAEDSEGRSFLNYDSDIPPMSPGDFEVSWDVGADGSELETTLTLVSPGVATRTTVDCATGRVIDSVVLNVPPGFGALAADGSVAGPPLEAEEHRTDCSDHARAGR